MSNWPIIKHRTRGRKGTHPHLVHFKGRGRSEVNECNKPSHGASKADLIEYHQEELQLRRSRQLARTPRSSWQPPRKNNDPAYRKSIWPAAKVARRSRQAATTEGANS